MSLKSTIGFTIAVLSMLVGSALTPAAASPDDRGWWSDVERLSLTTMAISESGRPYSTTDRPRDLIGTLNLSCEHVAGAPCGNGLGAYADLDVAAGYSTWFRSDVGLRSGLHTDVDVNALSIERATVEASLRAVRFVLGREAFSLGPSRRTQHGWSDHAAPLDLVRLSTNDDIRMGPKLRLSASYTAGRLRDPQRYPGALVTISRLLLRAGGRTEIGVVQLLELGGDGARELTALDFLLEHVRRAHSGTGDDDSSNRRFGGDISLRIPELKIAALYYTLVFEDIRRRRWMDAVRYDADHLIGAQIELASHTVVLEWQKTGVRSQEHSIRTTGFTNAGRTVGGALGPDATALFAGLTSRMHAAAVSPWFEIAVLSSDKYVFVENGPIDRTSRGETEDRYRAGVIVEIPIVRSLVVRSSIFAEHVDDFAFETSVTHNNVGVTLSVSWYPSPRVGSVQHMSLP